MAGGRSGELSPPGLGLADLGRPGAPTTAAKRLRATTHRPLARGRRRVRPSVGRRRRGPGRATDGRLLGTGRTASSDGQFFPAAGRGEALNLVNARYGAEPGVKAYSHVSDRFSPFATQTIPATVPRSALPRIIREGVDSGRDTRASVWYKRSVHKRLATTEAPA